MDLKGLNLGWELAKIAAYQNNRNGCISKQQSLYNVTNESISMGLNQGWTKRRSYKKQPILCLSKSSTTLQILCNRIWSFLRINMICMQHIFTNSTDISFTNSRITLLCLWCDDLLTNAKSK